MSERVLCVLGIKLMFQLAFVACLGGSSILQLLSAPCSTQGHDQALTNGTVI